MIHYHSLGLSSRNHSMGRTTLGFLERFSPASTKTLQYCTFSNSKLKTFPQTLYWLHRIVLICFFDWWVLSEVEKCEYVCVSMLEYTCLSVCTHICVCLCVCARKHLCVSVSLSEALLNLVVSVCYLSPGLMVRGLTSMRDYSHTTWESSALLWRLYISTSHNIT